MGSGYLFDAAEKLRNASNFYFSSEELSKCVLKHAAAAAVASMASGVLPGAGAVIAGTITTGAVWAMYIKMSNIIGVKLEKKTLKVIASAVLSNLAVNAVGMFVLSFIPGVSIIGCGFTAFASLYASAIVFLTCLTRIFKGTRSDLDDAEWKSAVNDAIRNMDLKSIIKEGRGLFSQMRNSGELNRQASNVDIDPSDDEDYEEY